MIVWLILAGIVAVGVAVVVVTQRRESRIDEDVAQTATLTETEATIQNAAMERLDKYTWFPSFSFSYSTGEEYRSGKFFLKANQEQSDELIKKLINRKLPVQFDPTDPTAWYIAQATMEECEIIQPLSADYPPDSGPYRSDGELPIDLNLNN